ncbi:hypothetical protein HDU78_007263 [Chytriomyces hyalinus]|nr:hypothetical protein HDU78_007263 [Chytriomyces hyalinus]
MKASIILFALLAAVSTSALPGKGHHCKTGQQTCTVGHHSKTKSHHTKSHHTKSPLPATTAASITTTAATNPPAKTPTPAKTSTPANPPAPAKTSVPANTPTPAKTAAPANPTTPANPSYKDACVVKSYADFPTCVASKSATILIKGPFTVPAEQVIDLTKLAPNTHVVLSGTVKFAKSTTIDGDGLALLNLGGAGITFDSDPANPGVLDGNGQLYWDGKGGNGGVPKPKMFRSTATANSLIKDFTVLNAPVRVFSIGGSDTVFDNIKIDVSLGDTKGGHNTDGFDVSGNGITIQNSWVHNQDDCLAINKSTGKGVKFLNNVCIGGHGISISAKEGGIVENVLVKDCVVKQSTNAIRIKTLYKATSGHVSNVVYDNVSFEGITKIGLSIQQDYSNTGRTGNPISNMPITQVTFSNVTGTMAAGSNARSVDLMCAPGMCRDVQVTGLNIKAAAKNLPTICKNVKPAGAGCP